MARVRNLTGTQQQIALTERDFKSLLPLREKSISFGLIEEKPKSIRTKRGRKSFFTPDGKVALNGNIHYLIFFGIRISPENQLTNYKLADSGKDNRTNCSADKIDRDYIIFFSIHIANVVNLARRESVKATLAA